MERTNRFNGRIFVLVLAALVAIAIIGIYIYANSNKNPVPTNTLSVNREIESVVVAPAMTPVGGELTYNCPSENSCSRTGSSEWFSLPSSGTTFTINTFGGTRITAASDMHGDSLTFTVSRNADGTTTLTFNEVVNGRILLTLSRGDTSTIQYGVR